MVTAFLLPGATSTLVAQGNKPTKKEIQVARIDSVFGLAERNQLDTTGVLRYEFYFSDRDEKRLKIFATRMEADTFEMESIQAQAKVFRLTLYKNMALSRASMFKLEQKLKWLKYKYYIDTYLGFSIHPADPDPLSVSDEEFIPFLRGLDSSQLLWVGNRLLTIGVYEKASVALQMCSLREYKPDTTAYQYGRAFLAMNEFNDAIRQWKKAVKINPAYLQVFLDLGKVHFENGYFKEALIYYQRAEVLQPEDSQILLHIAETQFALELYNQSYAYAQRAHHLNRKNRFTKSLLKLLKQPHIRYLRKIYPQN